MLKYDKENITEKTVKAVRAITDKPEFSLEDVRKANAAMEGICKWAMAMMKYYDLLKIKPVAKAMLRSAAFDREFLYLWVFELRSISVLSTEHSNGV